MGIEVLVSTMNQNDFSLLDRMNIESDALIINQCNEKGDTTFIHKNHSIKWINTETRGLSTSRNMGINAASNEICILSDDDIVFVEGYKSVVAEQFRKYPEADIITFQVEGIEGKFKNYGKNSKNIYFHNSMKVSSVEIAFKLDSIRKKKIQFNDLFGAGSKYLMGEENIFLIECIKKKLNIKYVPIKIADLYMGNSSWFKGYNDKYFFDRGAIFAAMSKQFYPLLIIQFALRKKELYKNDKKFIDVVRSMRRGAKEYLTEIYKS